MGVAGLSLCLVAVPAAGSPAWAATRAPSAGTSLGPEIPATSPNGKGGSLTSVNWAGYVDTGPTFSSVSGAWVQPTASCPQNQVQQAAFWVGIGGFARGDPDIEQVGTDSDCTKGKGKRAGGPSYYAWYQMYPDSLVVLPTTSYPVAPDESIEASVTVIAANDFRLSITDAGHWTFTTDRSQASQPADASAEWITEAPSSCTNGGKCKVLPLADFGAVGYAGAAANGEAISGSGLTYQPITMTSKNGKQVKASTSSLGSGGSSFSVSWVS